MTHKCSPFHRHSPQPFQCSLANILESMGLPHPLHYVEREEVRRRPLSSYFSILNPALYCDQERLALLFKIFSWRYTEIRNEQLCCSLTFYLNPVSCQRQERNYVYTTTTISDTPGQARH